MNPIVKNITINLIISGITFALIHLIHQVKDVLPADTIIFALIFTAVTAARMFGTTGRGAKTLASNKETGVIKWFSVKKGYGFITSESNQDIFVHHSEIIDNGKPITEGQEVKFVAAPSDKGLQANEVEIL